MLQGNLRVTVSHQCGNVINGHASLKKQACKSVPEPMRCVAIHFGKMDAPFHVALSDGRIAGIRAETDQLWRYMDLWKLVSMLANRGLYFPVVATLGDQLEAAPLELPEGGLIIEKFQRSGISGGSGVARSSSVAGIAPHTNRGRCGKFTLVATRVSRVTRLFKHCPMLLIQPGRILPLST